MSWIPLFVLSKCSRPLFKPSMDAMILFPISTDPGTIPSALILRVDWLSILTSFFFLPLSYFSALLASLRMSCSSMLLHMWSLETCAIRPAIRWYFSLFILCNYHLFCFTISHQYEPYSADGSDLILTYCFFIHHIFLPGLSHRLHITWCNEGHAFDSNCLLPVDLEIQFRCIGS